MSKTTLNLFAALLLIGAQPCWPADNYRPPRFAGKGGNIAMIRFDGSAWLSRNATQYDKSVDGLVPLDFDLIKIRAAGSNFKGLTKNGDIISWGANRYGQAGDGITDPYYDPAFQYPPVKINSGFIDVEVDPYSSCALRKDGALFKWGMRYPNQKPSDSTPTQYSEPKWGSVSIVNCDASGIIALSRDGTLLSFSENGKGDMPVPDVLGTDFIAASVKLGIKKDGTLFDWKANAPVLQTDGTAIKNVVAIASGSDHNLYIQSDGSLWAWGDNSVGQLGNGTYENSSFPVRIGDGFVALGADGYFSQAMKADGSLWVWGWIGTNLGETLPPPENISWPWKIGEGYRSLRSSQYHTLAFKADGSLWSWGYNEGGALGRPIKSWLSAQDRWGYWMSAAPVPGDGFIQVAAGGGEPLDRHDYTSGEDLGVGDYSAGIRVDGSLWGWGHNRYVVPSVNEVPQRLEEGVQAVSLGYRHALMIKQDGSLWAWGDNSFGQVGNGSNAGSSFPIWIGTGFRDVFAGPDYSFAIHEDGALWAWGHNDAGQLGDGTIQDRNLPVLVGKDFVTLSPGNGRVLAVKSDGSLWTWGGNNSVAPLLKGKRIRKVVAGSSTLFAIGEDGALWVWYNSTPLKSPELLGYDFVDASVQGFNQNMDSSYTTYTQYFAVRSDGSLWAWGGNLLGRLGVCSCRNTPTQVMLGRGDTFAAWPYMAGPPQSHTLTFDLRPRAQDRALPARLFVAVSLHERLGGGWLGYTGKGWIPWDGNAETLPSFQSVAALPEIQTTVLYRDSNIVELSGAQLYVGYGTAESSGDADAFRAMLRDKTFSNVYSLP